MIRAKCPASCGEMLQGLIFGSEKLISCPIDCYSYVTLYKGKRKDRTNYKSYKMLEEIFKHYGYFKEESSLISIDIQSEIPRAKGMASSTADLAATAIAAAKYLGKEITEDEIAKLCIEIEPTDSTVFSQMTLFDHLTGNYVKKYNDFPRCKVMILEGKTTINTLHFRKVNRVSILRKNEEDLKKAIFHFERGIQNHNLYDIGKAVSISAFANERIVCKKGIEMIYDMSLFFGAFGINIAHSGTVIGILFEEDRFDKEAFLYQIKEKEFMSEYENVKEYQIISGGAKIL